jgi:hypothetical protein
LQVTADTPFWGNTTVYARWRADNLPIGGVPGGIGWLPSILNWNRPGDVNGDGEINTTDAMLILRYIAGVLNENELAIFCRIAADINRDGEITTADALMILRIAAGLPPTEPLTWLWPVENTSIDTTCLFCCERDWTHCTWCLAEPTRHRNAKGELRFIRGTTTASSHHTGLDIGNGTAGANILAARAGTITKIVISTARTGYGTYIEICHGDGYVTLYAHLQVEPNIEELERAFRSGETIQVRQEQIIGKLGNTGFSDAAHLHFEIIKNGKEVNPLNYIQRP